jgi:hypothetical protein
VKLLITFIPEEEYSKKTYPFTIEILIQERKIDPTNNCYVFSKKL